MPFNVNVNVHISKYEHVIAERNCSLSKFNFSSEYANSISTPGSTTPTYEAVLETSYVIQLNKYLGVQPDIQYVIRPNGYGNIPNALVIGLQAVLSF